MIKKIRILLVDDQSLFREGMKTLLSVQEDFDVVGEAANGEEALRLAARYQPDVVLMDVRMPVMDGIQATRRLQETLPECKVIVLTTFEDDDNVFEGLRAGAVGYLLKDVSSEKLYEALRAAARGEYFMLPSITAKVMAEFSRLSRPSYSGASELAAPLSAREMEILALLATGVSNKEIAAHLVIAEGTVKNHVTSILSKLEVKDRMQAVLRAKELNLI
ncbi:LuxR family transcriptional regulator [Ornatilinea apprima]|uniref:LuxR family transcriptional regulator n=1 Tax=Ornatilinea apprima TaxID=1134406 RepID=A0A0P6X7T3_9CHLR|nr:response regulator transcription factor [Ornatilinea apprima]KPL71211.1 LuxR family transcriptional regulator [Ornatilinea apprima]